MASSESISLDYDDHAFLACIKAVILIITGTRGREISGEVGTYLAEHIADSKLVRWSRR